MSASQWGVARSVCVVPIEGKAISRIWLITTGEPLPLEAERPHRTGMLANKLVDAGHDVTWWTTTFDHQTKSFLYRRDSRLSLRAGVELVLLHGRTPYWRNVSVRRLINHIQVARSFRCRAALAPRPDVIVCSFPTIDLSREAVRFGRARQVPVVIDVRDLWPDIFVFPFPPPFRSLVRTALIPYFCWTKEVFSNCDAIVAVSSFYLDWGLRNGKRTHTPSERVFPLGYPPPETRLGNLDEQKAYFTQQGINPAKKTVWFVGTFGRTYDLLPIIECARSMKDNRNVQFVITGDGEKRRLWQNAASGLDNVFFTGWVSGDKLEYLMRLATVGLMTYAPDAPQGLPNKIFEYMAAGLPILSSLRGETRKLLEYHRIGFTYDPQDPADALAKLRVMISDSTLSQEMGEKARRLFESEFSADRVYGQYAEYIREVALNGPKPTPHRL